MAEGAVALFTAANQASQSKNAREDRRTLNRQAEQIGELEEERSNVQARNLLRQRLLDDGGLFGALGTSQDSRPLRRGRPMVQMEDDPDLPSRIRLTFDQATNPRRRRELLEQYAGEGDG